jgi:hypothetical protein
MSGILTALLVFATVLGLNAVEQNLIDESTAIAEFSEKMNELSLGISDLRIKISDNEALFLDGNVLVAKLRPPSGHSLRGDGKNIIIDKNDFNAIATLVNDKNGLVRLIKVFPWKSPSKLSKFVKVKRLGNEVTISLPICKEIEINHDKIGDFLQIKPKEKLVSFIFHSTEQISDYPNYKMLHFTVQLTDNSSVKIRAFGLDIDV